MLADWSVGHVFFVLSSPGQQSRERSEYERTSCVLASCTRNGGCWVEAGRNVDADEGGSGSYP